MRISFFEEFPTQHTLKKINIFSKKTKLYLAASSLVEFKEIKQKNKNKGTKDLVYWPILRRKEGYWISPFSKRKALLRIFSELKEKEIPVMLDLELPTTQNPFLYFSQLHHFFANKKLISSFIEDYEGEVYLAEYYPEGKRQEKALQKLGLHFSSTKICKKVKIIKMMYHSLHHFSERFVQEELQRGVQEYGKNFLVGLGLLASGLRPEPRISPQQLEKDLLLAQKAGVEEAVLYRLGGLHKEYLKVIARFA